MSLPFLFLFFFNVPSTPEIYTLSLHDALPIYKPVSREKTRVFSLSTRVAKISARRSLMRTALPLRSEEHTSELQSRFDLVCRLLLEKKKPTNFPNAAFHQHFTPHNSEQFLSLH